MKNVNFRNRFLFVSAVIIGFCMMFSCISYAQTTSSVTTIGYFYSASGQMIDAEDSTGTMSSYLTRGERYNGIDETFAVSNIKDITADLDSNGNVLNKYTYTAYGTQTSYSATSNIQHPTLSISTNPFTYSDYYTDRESGNYYLNARYYDSTLGLFLTSDSYNLPNRYMYVNGNPVMGIDPTGHVTNFFCGAFHLGWENGQFHNGWGNWEESDTYRTLHPQDQGQNKSHHSIVQQDQEEPQQNIVQQEESHHSIVQPPVNPPKIIRIFDYDETLLVNGKKNSILANNLPENVLKDPNNIILTQGTASQARLQAIKKEWKNEFEYKAAYGYEVTGKPDGSKFNIIERLSEIRNNSDNIDTIVLYDDLKDRHTDPDYAFQPFDSSKLNPKREYYFGHVDNDQITYYKFDFIQDKFIKDLYNGGKIIS